MPLHSDIQYLKGVGPKHAELYHKLGVFDIADLLELFPRGYYDFSSPSSISDCTVGEVCSFKLRVIKKMKPAMLRKNMTIFKLLVTDNTADMVVTIFNNKYQFASLIEDNEYFFLGKVSGTIFSKELSSPVILPVSTDVFMPKYLQTKGLTSKTIRKNIKTALLNSEITDFLPEWVKLQNTLPNLDEALQCIHFPKSPEQLNMARRRLVFDELLTMQLGLRMLRGRTRSNKAIPFLNSDLHEFYSALPFELTAGQKNAIADVMSDLGKVQPMNRLIQGDVGSGKTMVAAAACFTAIKNGSQAAVMAPTEILAKQHYKNLAPMFESFDFTVALLTSSTKKAEKNAIKSRLATGEIQLIIGTHSVIEQNVIFKNLALTVTDEQQRFGVSQRAKLIEKGAFCHNLVMSATPIPRTLALILYGDLDISIIKDLPPGRQSISTHIVGSGKRADMYKFISDEIKTGGQAYIVCPLIDSDDPEDISSVIKYTENLKTTLLSKYEIGVLHGKLKPAEKQSIMEQFLEGKIQILVSTTVIEVGVDVPNASIMIIESAERFGLSQLHQLRGRVGRGSRKSYCFLLPNAKSEVERLKYFSSTTDGFKIAEFDLKTRGPGNFFGKAQHGLPDFKIADISADTTILATSTTVAEEIFSKDPKLNLAENKALKQQIYHLFQTPETKIIN